MSEVTPEPAGSGAETSSGHDLTRRWLSIITLLCLFGYITLITVVNIENKELANVALGFLLGTAGSAVYGFYYGTSASSSSKDATLNQIIQKETPKQ